MLILVLFQNSEANKYLVNTYLFINVKLLFVFKFIVIKNKSKKCKCFVLFH